MKPQKEKGKGKKHTTHYACDEVLKKYGGKAKGCCCTGHECNPSQKEGWERRIYKYWSKQGDITYRGFTQFIHSLLSDQKKEWKKDLRQKVKKMKYKEINYHDYKVYPQSNGNTDSTIVQFITNQALDKVLDLIKK